MGDEVKLNLGELRDVAQMMKDDDEETMSIGADELLALVRIAEEAQRLPFYAKTDELRDALACVEAGE